MVLGKTIRLSKLAREFNVGIHTIVDFLNKKGYDYDSNPNTKISEEALALLEKEYKKDLNLKKESEKIILKSQRPKQEVITIDDRQEEEPDEEDDFEEEEPKVIPKKAPPKPVKKKEPEEAPVEKPKHEDRIKIIGKIELDKENKPVKTEKKPVEEEPQPEPPKIEVPEVEEVQPEVEQPSVPEKEEETVQPEPPAEVPAEKEEEENIEIPKEETLETEVPKVEELKVIGRIDLDALNQKTRPAKKSRKEREKERRDRRRQRNVTATPEEKQPQLPIQGQQEQEPVKKADEIIRAKAERLNGPTVVGRIELSEKKLRKQKDIAEEEKQKKRRKRIKETGRIKLDDKTQERGKSEIKLQKAGGRKKKVLLKKEVDEVEVQKQIKDTLARLTSKGKSKGSKHRRDKRAAMTERMHADQEKHLQEKKVLKVTEFVSVSELATMMNVNVNEVISTCMSLGLFVSINQRLDAETLSVVAEEFGYKVEFVSADLQDSFEAEEDSEEDLRGIFTEQLDIFMNLVPSFFVFIGVGAAFLVQWLSYKLINRIEKKKLHFPPFRKLRLPVSIIWLYLLVIITSLFDITPSGIFYIGLQNALLILEMLLVVQGFSFIFYFSHHKKWSRTIPVVSVVLTIVFPIFLLYFVRILGIIDIGLNLRDRLEQKDK